jgi:hypothetical protein
VTACIEVTIATIDLLPPVATNELGSESPQTHTVTAVVAAGPDGGVGGEVVDFEVLSGPNAGASGSDTTDAAGQATFTYPATQGPAGLGVDTIGACLGPDEQGDTVCDRARKRWVDTTPPVPSCTESVNPHGSKTPPAGSTTLPGPKGGQNEDGFYELGAEDAVWPEGALAIFVNGFGPFAVGDVIKYTQADGATPSSKKMGSNSGDAGAVTAHIKGNGDASVVAIDGSGNASDPLVCLVPQPPK